MKVYLLFALMFIGQLIGLDATLVSGFHVKTKKELCFLTTPAKIGEEDLLYELIRELALYEGKDIDTCR